MEDGGFLLILCFIGVLLFLAWNSKPAPNPIEEAKKRRDEFASQHGASKEHVDELKRFLSKPENWDSVYAKLLPDLIAIWGDGWKSEFDLEAASKWRYGKYETKFDKGPYYYALILLLAYEGKIYPTNSIMGFHTGLIDYDNNIKVYERMEKIYQDRGINVRLVIPDVTFRERVNNPDKKYYNKYLWMDFATSSKPKYHLRLW